MGQFRRNPIVQRPEGPPKVVKNLGWLLRNHAGVESLRATATENGGILWASLRDGTVYTSEFNSFLVLLRWLNRPSFRGLPLNVNGANMTVGDRSHFEYNFQAARR